MSEFLDTAKAEIRSRMAELEEHVNEHGRLQAALTALEHVSDPITHAAPKRRGRPPGSGARSHEAIAVLTDEPGLTPAEIAERMGIQQNYLYRLLPALLAEGKLRKESRRWYVAG